MRQTKLINLSLIERPEHLPLDENVLELAVKLKLGEVTIESLPPIKTIENATTKTHTIRDGRHRYTAAKLAGITKLKCKFYEWD